MRHGPGDPQPGIAVAITDAVPEISEVVDVTDHISGVDPYFASDAPEPGLVPEATSAKRLTRMEELAACHRGHSKDTDNYGGAVACR